MKRIRTSDIISRVIYNVMASGHSRAEATLMATDYIVKFIQNNYRRRKKT